MFRKRMIIGVLRCLLIAVPLAASLASEQQGFEDVAGSWSGSGSMKPSDGPRERVKLIAAMRLAPWPASESLQ